MRSSKLIFLHRGFGCWESVCSSLNQTPIFITDYALLSCSCCCSSCCNVITVSEVADHEPLIEQRGGGAHHHVGSVPEKEIIRAANEPFAKVSQSWRRPLLQGVQQNCLYFVICSFVGFYSCKLQKLGRF